jgi:hypothetical protein
MNGVTTVIDRLELWTLIGKRKGRRLRFALAVPGAMNIMEQVHEWKRRYVWGEVYWNNTCVDHWNRHKKMTDPLQAA